MTTTPPVTTSTLSAVSLGTVLATSEHAFQPGEAILTAESLSLAFGGTKAITDVSFHVEAHELFENLRRLRSRFDEFRGRL